MPEDIGGLGAGQGWREVLPGPVVIVGAGRAGRAVAGALVRAGVPVAALWNRTRRDFGGTGLPGGLRLLYGPDLPDPGGAGVVLLAVSDDSIQPVGAALAREGHLRPGSVLLHLSGTLVGSEAAGPSPTPGVAYGSWHPLQALAGDASWPAPFYVTLEGDAEALRVGAALAEAVGCRAVQLPTAGKTLYHAAAVLASNLLVALEAVAVRTLAHSGVPEADRMPLLLPLVRGTVANLAASPPARALTGPVARGDAGVVARHLEALGQVDARAAEVYRQLATEALDLVAPSLPPERAGALRRALAR